MGLFLAFVVFWNRSHCSEVGNVEFGWLWLNFGVLFDFFWAFLNRDHLFLVLFGPKVAVPLKPGSVFGDSRAAIIFCCFSAFFGGFFGFFFGFWV